MNALLNAHTKALINAMKYIISSNDNLNYYSYSYRHLMYY